MQNDMKQLFLNKCIDVDVALEKYIINANVFGKFTLFPFMIVIYDLNVLVIMLFVFEH